MDSDQAIWLEVDARLHINLQLIVCAYALNSPPSTIADEFIDYCNAKHPRAAQWILENTELEFGDIFDKTRALGAAAPYPDLLNRAAHRMCVFPVRSPGGRLVYYSKIEHDGMHYMIEYETGGRESRGRLAKNGKTPDRAVVAWNLYAACDAIKLPVPADVLIELCAIGTPS